MNDAADARARQQVLYGAPLGDCIRTITSQLSLSQAAVARVLGISAPMLSQLVNAQRTKIGNPVAAERLHSLLDLADGAGELAPEDIEQRIDRIAADESTTMTRRRETQTVTDAPEAVHAVLHAVASGREIRAAAELMANSHPGVAEMLRVYGLGSAAQRAEHYAALTEPS